MRGEFLPVWSETWRDVWSPLAKHPGAPADLFSELYRELSLAFISAPLPEALAEVSSDTGRGRATFRQVKSKELRGERALVEFFERAQFVTIDLGGDPLANRYFLLVETFLTKFSLRYDLRRPFTLHPTLPGVFARLIGDLKDIVRRDTHLHLLMVEFEDSIRDLRADSSAGRIKTCIQKQVNLLEAIGRSFPAVTETTLGRICDQLGVAPNIIWPHNQVRDAMKNLYRFASDYPGIRHGGTPAHALREIEMKDMVAITVLLAGFAPYLSHQLNSDIVYRGI